MKYTSTIKWTFWLMEETIYLS